MCRFCPEGNESERVEPISLREAVIGAVIMFIGIAGAWTWIILLWAILGR